MSLIKCPECQKEVSSAATSCPHCGYPLKADKKEIADNTMKCTAEVDYPQPISNEWIKKWKNRAKFIRIFWSIFFLCVSIYSSIRIAMYFVTYDLNTMFPFWSVIIWFISLCFFLILLINTHCSIRQIDGYNVVAYCSLTNKLIIEDKICQKKWFGRYLYGKLPNGKNIKVVFSAFDAQPDIQVSINDF